MAKGCHFRHHSRETFSPAGSQRACFKGTSSINQRGSDRLELVKKGLLGVPNKPRGGVRECKAQKVRGVEKSSSPSIS